MKTATIAPRQRRSGMTLIELLVVLVVLVALAGLLVPLLPSVLTRAHTATCATNMGDTCRAIGVYDTLYSGYGNNYDSLTDGAGNVITYFANGTSCPGQYLDTAAVSAGPGNNEVTALALTANEIAALNAVGITNLQIMVGTTPANPQAAGFDPTFQNYPPGVIPTANTMQVTTGTVLAGMDPTAGTGSTAYARCVALNYSLTGRYVCLGVGPRCDLVTKVMMTAPVHFGDQPVLNPEYGYQRLMAIFKVSDTAVPAYTQAQLMGVAPLHDTGLGSIQDELQNWYQLSAGGS